MIRTIFFALALAACATPVQEATPQQAATSKAAIKVYETICYFTCASYEIVVRADGSYALDNRENTPKPGHIEGKFGADVFAKAEAAFDAAKFGTLPDRLDRSTMTSGIFCMSDLPDIHFTRIAADGTEKKVLWMTGCGLPDMAVLRDTLRGLFQYTTLVKPAPAN